MGSEAVKVIVRCRPINEREERLSCEVILAMETSVGQVQLQKPKNTQAAPKFFTFDGVYYMKDTTQQIYEEICFPLVEGVLQGFNGTVFAYGQTGCGKSYTMMGVEDPPENKGIIPRAFDHVFDQVAVEEDMKYMVQASYLEIYNEEVRDLLGRDVKKKLELHEHPEKGIYVQGLSHHKVLNVHDLERVMELGSKNRSVGATLMNVDSSRSHSIFTINIEMMEVSEGRLKCGRLNLVDLAGSERQSKTGSTGERLKEATKINLSLSALGNVISALVDGRSTHIPYRDSKLTRLLQSSLGGNTKTLMIACVSPADNNFDETLSTLRYANRAKNIKNKPRINEDPKDALLREYREEIERLKQLLLGQGSIPQEPSGIPQEPSAQLQALEEEKEAIRREYEAKIAELREQFGKEQSDRAGLQEELGKLQKAFDEQLAAAQERHIPASETLQHLPGVALPPAPTPTPAPTHITPSQGALPSHSQLVPEGGGRPVDGDRVAVPPAPAPMHITPSQGALPSYSQLVPGGGGRPVDGDRVAVPPAPAPAPITPSQVALPSHSQLVPGGGGRPVDGERVAVPPAPAPTHITPSQGALPSHSQLVPGGGGRPVDGDRVAVPPAPALMHITPSQGALPSYSQLMPGGGGRPVDGGRVVVPPAPAPTHITPSQGALPSHSQLVPGGGGRPVDGDREILRQHEQALQRLEELQKGMIGGERAGDEGLKQQLQQRRKRADERLEALRHASSELEDDGIIERIFNSLTDEVRVKTKLLERSQAKAKSAEEDIKDLSAEFEIDRQDYLDTIRKQERTIKLQQQLLETIVPCLRRDCNYYNLDKVRSECVWDEDQLEWVLPKLITTRTNLAHIDSGSTLGERRSASTSKLPRHRASSNETQIQSPPSVVSNLPPPNHVQASAYDPPESDRYLVHLHRSAEPNYFKPKRSRELLAQSAQMKGSGAAEKADVLGKGGNLQPVTVTAAAIHGVDSRIIGDSSYSRRPGKLQSLSINPTLPQNLPPITDSHILDKVEKRLSNRKRNSLEPLQDKHRKPPM